MRRGRSGAGSPRPHPHPVARAAQPPSSPRRTGRSSGGSARCARRGSWSTCRDTTQLAVPGASTISRGCRRRPARHQVDGDVRRHCRLDGAWTACWCRPLSTLTRLQPRPRVARFVAMIGRPAASPVRWWRAMTLRPGRSRLIVSGTLLGIRSPLAVVRCAARCPPPAGRATARPPRPPAVGRVCCARRG